MEVTRVKSVVAWVSAVSDGAFDFGELVEQVNFEVVAGARSGAVANQVRKRVHLHQVAQLLNRRQRSGLVEGNGLEAGGEAGRG